MKIGWIGTGVMGAAMAGHLQAAGHELFVFNRTRQRADSLVEKGARWCPAPADVAAEAEIIFTIVGFPRDVEKVYLGDEGVFSKRGACRIFVDMTTSTPSLAKNLEKKAEKQGMHSLDAPVSGGDIGAREGNLAIMVGGRKDVFKEVLPLLEVFGSRISYMGQAGAGQHTKMANQILISGTMVGVCESLLYAERQGLDQQAVIDIIGQGAAGSWSINNLGPRIVRGDYKSGFFVEHFVKDMGIALEEAAVLNLSLPGLALAHQLYLAVKAQGHARSATQALMLALKALNGGDFGE
jgi:3-hydroxyisobutyrate dehydrogenase